MEKNKKMKLLKNKNAYSILAILLILSFVVSMLALPLANAQTVNPNNRPIKKAYPFVDAVPMKVGVGQPALINLGLLNQLNEVNDGWNVTLSITDPDNKVETVKLKTFATGTVGYHYAPMKEGNYTLKCIFGGEEYFTATSGTARSWYEASESENITLQAIGGYWKPSYPGHSLPQEYWSRPIDSQLREWYTIAGSWLVNKLPNLYAPWNEAPESAHILWTMPIGDTMGGLAGGDNGVGGFQIGDAYEGKFAGSIIVAGNLYYNRYVSNSPQQTIVAVDLHTGKTLWERSYSFGGGRVAHGQVLTFNMYNSHGVWAYIWMTSGTTWYALDAKTGDLKYNMTNVPSGTNYYGPNGEILKYSLQSYSGTLHLLRWNSTYVVNNGTRTGTADAWGSNVQGRQYDATRLGYDRNVSTGITGTATSLGNLLTAFPEDRVIYGNYSASGVTLTAISLDPENMGYPLFTRRQWQAPNEWKDLTTSGSQSGFVAYSKTDLVTILWTKENRVNYAFSLETGKFLWETEPQVYADAWAGATANSSPEKLIAYGRLFEAGPGGVVYCYDIKTGERIWIYEVTDKYMESYMRENWWIGPVAISDGKIYLGHREHSPSDPKPRGGPFICLNATSNEAEVIWEINGAFRQTMWGGRGVMGDSVIATMDTYDQQIYGIGKGPSAMTVSAPDVAVTAGTPFVIRGTVMDISPGTDDFIRQKRFASGVPAVSDESMSEWMLYVYKNFERPLDAKGVDIDIWAFDPNGNEVHIGNTVSDASGTFSYTYTPEIDGDYEIFAYFMGSKSYYGSYAKTDMTVMAAPEVTEVELPPYGWYIVGATIAIIAVLIVGIFLILRKIKQ